MTRLELKIPPPVWFVIAVGLAYGIDWLAPWARIQVGGLPQVGVLVAVISVLFAMAGIRAFRRHKTTIHPMDPTKTSALVMEGPYRLTRNPMYLGLVGVLLATACALQNPLAILVIPAFIWVITRVQIIPEERALAAAFGEAFDAYASRVPRWLVK